MANGALLTMIMASRLVFGMAEQRLLPRPLARVLPHRRMPWVSIVVTTLVAIALLAQAPWWHGSQEPAVEDPASTST